MIDYRQIETQIVENLQDWLSSKGHECPVVMANQTAPIPAYPYISYTITTAVSSNQKGYSIAADGTRYKELVQTWSFTAQSDDDVEAAQVAMLAYDWFALAGHTNMKENGIVAQRVGSITNRDNFITIEYEYRQGFDVDFLLMHTLDAEDCETAGYVDEVQYQAELEV